MSLTSFRDKIKEMSPTWLADGRNERLMYTLALGLDLLAEKAVQAVHMWNPKRCDVSALPTIGNDRLTVRGATELESRYRQRLSTAIEDWSHAGTDWEVLRQMLHTLLELRPAARTVAARYTKSGFPWAIADSKWNAYAAGDDADAKQPLRTLVEPGNWDWDSVIRGVGSWCWSRIWVVVESIGPNAWCTPTTRTWGDGTKWGSGLGWGVDGASPAVFDSLWNEILTRKAANARCQALIISFDAAHFDPAQPAGGGINPDGTYGRWSRMSGRNQIPTRTAVSDCGFSHRIQ